ncbi:MAG: ABC transporter permease [Gammaproteobacteria bacterium]|nr:ABC transporter permease [Gammaproteobacteria bacterium]
MIQTVWQYREFVLSSILNELKIRFSRSRLGFFWMILQPLLQVMIYAFILSNVLSAKLPNMTHQHAYVFYLMSGTVAWSLIQEVVTRFLTLFIEQANLIKKMSFPKLVLVASAAGVALLNHVILFVVTIGILLLLGLPVVWPLLLFMPVLMLMLAGFAVGLGLVLGVLNVFVRDLAYVVPILLQLLFWATPIVYPISILPPQLQAIVAWNPILPMIQSYQDVMLYGQFPSGVVLLKCLVLSVMFLSMGWMVFHRANEEMADVL